LAQLGFSNDGTFSYLSTGVFDSSGMLVEYWSVPIRSMDSTATMVDSNKLMVVVVAQPRDGIAHKRGNPRMDIECNNRLGDSTSNMPNPIEYYIVHPVHW
jgi:roadblock/LC7 domain-containing protein